MPKIIYSSSPDSGIIKPNYLHDAVNTTNSRLRCGLTVVASITGKTVTEVRDAFRLHRFGARVPRQSHQLAPARSKQFCACAVTSGIGAHCVTGRR